jgi:hypothetical protein
MSSILPSGKFKIKEGEFWAGYMRNMLTKSATSSNVDLINGDKLRGYYIKHSMSNWVDSEVTLLSAEIEYELSNNT